MTISRIEAAFAACNKANEALNAALNGYRKMQYCPVGLTVTVVKGRKVKVGSSFVVQQSGEGRFGPWVRDGNGTYIDRRNVDITDVRFTSLRDAVDRLSEVCGAAAIEVDDAKKAVVAAAGINLNCRENVKYEQQAYRDVATFDTICNPDASDDLIHEALGYADPQGSCWGALRWSCGTHLVSRLAPDRIRVSSSTGIAD